MTALNPIEFAADIVAAFVSHNSVPVSEVPSLLATVHAAFTGCTEPGPQAVAEPPTPAVSVRRSITPDYLICLDDGKRYKALRRHLAGLGMTPEQYRAKWGLPLTYPMVAANYAALRSAMAKRVGLGQPRSAPIAASAASPRKRGRPRKVAG